MNTKKNLSTGEKAALAIYSATRTCFNPDCTEPLIVERSGRQIVNFVCAHIRDELPPSEKSGDIDWRYWPAEDMTQDERNRYGNLILVCSPCHKLIDKINPRAYPVSLLHDWKSAAESKCQLDSLLSVSAEELEQLVLDAVKKRLDSVYEVSLVGGEFGHPQKGEGLFIEIENTGIAEIPPFTLAIYHDLVGTSMVFQSDANGLLLPHQKRMFFMSLCDFSFTTPFPTRPSAINRYVPFFLRDGEVGGERFDPDKCSLRMILDQSERVLYENKRFGMYFVRACRKIFRARTIVDVLDFDDVRQLRSLPGEDSSDEANRAKPRK